MPGVQYLFESLEIHPPGGGDDRHHKPLVGFDDHHFGEHISGTWRASAVPRAVCVGRAMTDHLVGNLVAVEIALEFLEDGHGDLRR